MLNTLKTGGRRSGLWNASAALLNKLKTYALCWRGEVSFTLLLNKLKTLYAGNLRLEDDGYAKDVSLDETEIRAPFDGIITEKYVEEGSMISNGTPLVAVQDPTDNWVDLKVPETQLADFSVGQDITLVGRDGKTKVTGTITDISKKAEFATQRATSERGDASDIVSFNVKIQINDPVLRPGMRFRLAGDAS